MKLHRIFGELAPNTCFSHGGPTYLPLHRSAFKRVHPMHISFAKINKLNAFLAYLKTIGSHIFYGDRF